MHRLYTHRFTQWQKNRYYPQILCLIYDYYSLRPELPVVRFLSLHLNLLIRKWLILDFMPKALFLFFLMIICSLYSQPAIQCSTHLELQFISKCTTRLLSIVLRNHVKTVTNSAKNISWNSRKQKLLNVFENLWSFVRILGFDHLFESCFGLISLC